MVVAVEDAQSSNEPHSFPLARILVVPALNGHFKVTIDQVETQRQNRQQEGSKKLSCAVGVLSVHPPMSQSEQFVVNLEDDQPPDELSSMHFAWLGLIAPVIAEELPEEIEPVDHNVSNRISSHKQFDVTGGSSTLIGGIKIVFRFAEDVDAPDLSHRWAEDEKQSEYAVEDEPNDLTAVGGPIPALHLTTK